MGLRRTLLRFTAEALVAPLLVSLAERVGDTVGEVIGLRIKPLKRCEDCDAELDPAVPVHRCKKPAPAKRSPAKRKR